MLRTIFILSKQQQSIFNGIGKCLMSSEPALVNTTQNNVKILQDTSTNNNELTNEIIDWDKELHEIKKEEQRSVLEPLQEKDDLSTFVPHLKPTFNFAAYVNKSKPLQELVKLGVDLSKLEKIKDVPDFILKLDYEKDIAQRVIYLHDLGVPMDEMGKFITKNPLILKEDVDDLQTRIYYLQYKRFKPEMISRIITNNPFWLNFSTKEIDTRLGHFQKTFKLTGNEIRSLATMQPRLITYSMQSIRENTFSIREEMGFEDEEMKALLLKKPRVWMQNRQSLLSKFHYIHNTMKISHGHILEMPEILYAREFVIRQRDSFLRYLNRDQYDRTKENYVSLKRLVEGRDADFCTNVARSTVEAYNLFLKTL